MNIKIAEQLHHVLQGEGKNLGVKMVILRTYGCSVQCPSCDSRHTWHPDFKPKEILEYSVEQIVEQLRQFDKLYGITHLMVTGGEPQNQQLGLAALFETLIRLGYKIDIETTGQKAWDAPIFLHKNIYYDLSPKIGALAPKIKKTDHKFFTHNHADDYTVKIVSSKESWEKDLEALKEFQNEYSIPNDKIHIMPFGMTTKEIQKEAEFLIDRCFEYRFSFSPRMHVLLFGDKKLV